MKTITLGALAEIIGGTIISGDRQTWYRQSIMENPSIKIRSSLLLQKKALKWKNRLLQYETYDEIAIVILRILPVQAKLSPSCAIILRSRSLFKPSSGLLCGTCVKLRPRVTSITGSAGSQRPQLLVASTSRSHDGHGCDTRKPQHLYSICRTYLARLTRKSIDCYS